MLSSHLFCFNANYVWNVSKETVQAFICTKADANEITQYENVFNTILKYIRNIYVKTLGFRAYSHRTSEFTLTSMLALTFERNTLVSIAPFTPSVSVNNGVKIQLGSAPSQKRYRWRAVWTRLNKEKLKPVVFNSMKCYATYVNNTNQRTVMKTFFFFLSRVKEAIMQRNAAK